MRRDHAILPIVIMLFGSFLIFKPVFGHVLISRIQIGGVSTTDEFVELYNSASTSQSMAGWSLKKITAGGSASNLVSAFPDALSLPAFSYLLITHRDYSPISLVTADITYTNASTILAANNSLLLYDELDQMVDRVDWGSVSTTFGQPANNPGESKSLTRLPNDEAGNGFDTDDSSVDFIEIDSNPRNSNSPSRPSIEIPIIDFTPDTPTTTTTSTLPDETLNEELNINILSGVVINEFVSNPETGEEWVELFNTTTSTITLSGATLCDNREADSCTIKLLEDEILSGEWKIFYLGGSKLNNDGDSVILKDSSGVIIDSTEYSEQQIPNKGESLARDPDGDGEWKISITPTPGDKNIITERPTPAPMAVSTGSGGGSYWTAPLITVKKSTDAAAPTDKTTLLWNLSLPKTIFINSSTYFDCHLSADPRGGDILYSWNMGDGSIIDGSKIYHTFASSGVYTITIYGTSTQGTFGHKTATIRVLNDIYNKNGVFIDSILPRPESDDEEWVAIGSYSSSSTDIGGWKIATDSGKSYTIPIKTVLKPYNLLRFRKSVTKLPLNDDGGTVFVSNSSGEVIDLMTFYKPKRGQIINTDDRDTELSELNQDVLSSSSIKLSSAKNSTTKNHYSSRPLADVRELPLKSFVTVSGEVVSLPGKPYANYFYIADDSAGLQIYSYKKLFPELKLGDRVSVYGEISSSNGIPRLKISSAVSIKKISSTSKLSTIPKNISEVDENDFGKLLTLEGEITDILSSSFYLDDTSAEATVAIPSGSGINKKVLRVGQTARVTGVVEKNKDGWKIIPRTASDLLTISEVSSSRSTKPISSKTKTALGLSGGIVLVGLTAALKRWVLKK